MCEIKNGLENEKMTAPFAVVITHACGCKVKHIFDMNNQHTGAEIAENKEWPCDLCDEWFYDVSGSDTPLRMTQHPGKTESIQ